ncbi:set domain protein [Stylonychia lemnae]|uniref:Set domain protein n=1 Tax=Stylonychia lemnae TaxID=5949 RepID=A0A078B669_STYLE|nr:set domain protein [Stylonychia lemnae]|eukprot:CDW88807.1 set domain protein [Stylonychia lemnae]
MMKQEVYYPEKVNIIIDLLTYINVEKTNQLKELPKYKNFAKWLKDNGVIYPAVDYPVAFGKHGYLIGMAAKQDIPPQKAFLFVPQKLMINEVVVRNSKISHIINKHPKIFKHHQDAEYLILIVFVWHELLKGEESFWYHYFQIINQSDLPMLWTEEEIAELQDQVMQKDILEYRAEYDNEMELVFSTFIKEGYQEFYPGLGDHEQEEHIIACYHKAYLSVVTRCFGWGLPQTSMIPFADCINHHNVDSTYELIHEEYHQDILNDESSRMGPIEYYTSSKIEGDYTDFFQTQSSQDSNQSSDQNQIEEQISEERKYQSLIRRQGWPKRTQNHMDKMFRRKQTFQLALSEFKESKTKEIWDVEYITTSDEEDNDTEEEEEESSSESETDQTQISDIKSQHSAVGQGHSKNLQKPKKKQGQPKDVVYQLIDQNQSLSKRDLQARLLKLKWWKESHKKFNQDNELYDVDEDFSWWSYYDEKVYYAMGAKFKTYYQKGDQLFNCYGLRTNRFLLINYGFCLRNNKYNSLGFKVFINYKPPVEHETPKNKKVNPETHNSDDDSDNSEEEEEIEEKATSRHQKIIRLKNDKLCEELLQYLRSNMIYTEQFRDSEHLLASSPIDAIFETHIITVAISLLANMLQNKYPTSIQHDKKLLEKVDDNYRLKIALIHRINQKEIIDNQIKLLTILNRIVNRVNQGMDLKTAYCLKVEDAGERTDADIVRNRVKLRKYLREFSHNQSVLKQQKKQKLLDEEQEQLQKQAFESQKQQE